MKFSGPPLEEGPLPAFIYLALSDEESLHLDPFNQPVQFLKNKPIRVFSLTIPGHGKNLDPNQAINVWRSEFDKGNDILTPFFDEAAKEIEAIKPHATKIAIGGLSRGVFCACHIASRLPIIQTILGFAPLIDLSYSKEFKNIDHLSLNPHIPTLSDRIIRFYIGNRDMRTGTDICFNFVHRLADAAFEKRSAHHRLN